MLGTLGSDGKLPPLPINGVVQLQRHIRLVTGDVDPKGLRRVERDAPVRTIPEDHRDIREPPAAIPPLFMRIQHR